MKELAKWRDLSLDAILEKDAMTHKHLIFVSERTALHMLRHNRFIEKKIARLHQLRDGRVSKLGLDSSNSANACIIIRMVALHRMKVSK